MKIEIAPDECYIICYYQEAILYCFSLNIDGKTGWRLPTHNEYCNMDQIDAYSWFVDRLFYPSEVDRLLTVVPVRDIT